MTPRLAAVSQRAGVSQGVGNAVYMLAAPIPEVRPWAKEVILEGERFVVGQGKNPEYFCVFPLPFSGHNDEWKVVLPMQTAQDLLNQLSEFTT